MIFYQEIKLDLFYLIKPILFFVFLNLNTGCDNRAIDPYESEETIYSMYGALEVDKSPNYIRVKDLQIPFSSEEASKFDATVRFEDLDSGITAVLEDTVVNFFGNITHNFIVEEPIKPLGQYRITVERSDGAVVQTVATAPHVTEVTAEPTEDVDCEQQIEFTFKNVPSPEQVRMEVGFLYQDKWHWSDVDIVAPLERIDNTDELYISMSPRNLLVEVFTPSLDGPDGRPIPPRFLFPTVHCHELDSNTAQIRYIHFGPEWEAVVPIWPVNPDDVLDVENGLGFVGAIRRGSFSFTIKQNVPE